VEANAHLCVDGRIKAYPSLLCSRCLPGEGIDIVTDDLKKVEDILRKRQVKEDA